MKSFLMISLFIAVLLLAVLIVPVNQEYREMRAKAVVSKTFFLEQEMDRQTQSIEEKSPEAAFMQGTVIYEEEMKLRGLRC